MWKLQRKLHRYQPFLMPISIIVVVILLLLLVLIPTVKTINDQFDEISQAKERVDGLKRKLTILSHYSEDELNSMLTELTAAIPVDKSIPSLMSTVQAVSGQTNVSIAKIEIINAGALSTESARLIAQEEKQFGAYIIPFSVNVLGNLDQLREFLKSTATVRRFVRPKSFRLNFAEGDQMSTQVSFDGFYALLPNKSPPVIQALSPQDQTLLQSVTQYPRLDMVQSLDPNEVPTKPNPFAP